MQKTDKINQANEELARIYMICTSEEVQRESAAMLKRVSAALSAVDTFFDKLTELDEDNPDFVRELGPVLHRLTVTLMALYPNARQMAVDVKTIGDFTVRTI